MRKEEGGGLGRGVELNYSMFVVITGTSITTTLNFVDSILDSAMIKIDFVSYYHLPQLVPFLIAGHIYIHVPTYTCTRYDCL